MALQPGDLAPDFKLFDTDKQEVQLSSLRGSNVLILFFPLAYTSVCTAELCATRDDIASYNNANAKVLGISVDSLFTLGKFKEDNNLNFKLLSDFNREASTAYGALYESFAFGMKGVSRRSAFVIDAEGVIRYAEVLESAGDQPNFMAIKEVWASLS